MTSARSRVRIAVPIAPERADYESGLLDGYCRDLGRDPAEIERSCFVGGDPWLAGPPLRERGVGMFTVITRGPGYDLDELRRWLDWRERIESHQNQAYS